MRRKMRVARTRPSGKLGTGLVMTQEQIDRLDQALKDAGTVFEAELYTGALHGFTMSDLPVYNRKACDKHWQRLLDLFKETLR
jgi:carboxymethylenebutenolidase